MVKLKICTLCFCIPVDLFGEEYIYVPVECSFSSSSLFTFLMTKRALLIVAGRRAPCIVQPGRLNEIQRAKK